MVIMVKNNKPLCNILMYISNKISKKLWHPLVNFLYWYVIADVLQYKIP
jgi:hypothetical protein